MADPVIRQNMDAFDEEVEESEDVEHHNETDDVNMPAYDIDPEHKKLFKDKKVKLFATDLLVRACQREWDDDDLAK